MEALAIDVKNYDAFKELVEGQMMTGEEGTRLENAVDIQNGSSSPISTSLVSSSRKRQVSSRQCTAVNCPRYIPFSNNTDSRLLDPKQLLLRGNNSRQFTASPTTRISSLD